VQKLAPSLEAIPNHRGPVWLDKVKENTIACRGFGSDVRCAIERRRKVLRGLGTAMDDPRRDVKLKELERRAVGEGIAARTRQQFLARAPDGFRGHVRAGPEGAPYAVVTDGSRFVLLLASRELRALNEKVVSVSRDDRGRLRVGAPERDRDR
jgi:hypothetical protein